MAGPEARSEAGGDCRRRVVLGRVGAAFGVQGWVKVAPFTEVTDTLLEYPLWQLGRGGSWSEHAVLAGRVQGRQLVVQLEGVRSREQARALAGSEVALWRHQLPALGGGEYYWADLVGLQVRTSEGVDLGRVARVMETGANDVLVVDGDRERLIPYLADQVVLKVDLAARRIEVDWDPEF